MATLLTAGGKRSVFRRKALILTGLLSSSACLPRRPASRTGPPAQYGVGQVRRVDTHVVLSGEIFQRDPVPITAATLF